MTEIKCDKKCRFSSPLTNFIPDKCYVFNECEGPWRIKRLIRKDESCEWYEVMDIRGASYTLQYINSVEDYIELHHNLYVLGIATKIYTAMSNLNGCIIITELGIPLPEYIKSHKDDLLNFQYDVDQILEKLNAYGYKLDKSDISYFTITHDGDCRLMSVERITTPTEWTPNEPLSLVKFDVVDDNIFRTDILVINLSQEDYYAFNHTHCGTDKKYNHNITMLNNKLNLELETYANVNKIIIYFDITYIDGVKKLLKFLIENNLYDKCMVYYNATVLGDINPDIHHFDDDIKDKFKIKKIFGLDYLEKTLLVSNYMPELSCNEWFKDAMNSMTKKCLKGRLKQFSGTCYLNAVVNGFILSSRARKLVFDKIQHSTPEDLKYIKSNVMTCHTEPKSERYFLQLFYNTLCKGIKSLTDNDMDRFLDIVKEYSKLYSIDDSGNGGYSDTTLLKIFNWLFGNINLIRYVNNITYFPISFHEEIPLLILNFEERPREIPKLITYRSFENVSYNYHLEFGIIYIVFYDDDGKYGSFSKHDDHYGGIVASHAICGIICDGNYIMYDSQNKIYDVDWTSLNDDNTTSIFSHYGRRAGFYIKCAVYARSDIDTRKSVRDMCEALN